MARQRFIHPEFWGDPSIAKLTCEERLFFIGCFSNADDEGRIMASPAWLRSEIYPYDDISLDQVRAMRDRVVTVCRSVWLYEVDGNEYLALMKWKEWQKPKYPQPSKLPPPPSTKPEIPNYQEMFPEVFPQNSGKVPGSLPEPLPHGLGRVGLGLGLDRDGQRACARDDINSFSDQVDTSPPPKEPEPPNGEAKQEEPPPDPYDRSKWDCAAKVPPTVWRDMDAIDDGRPVPKQLDILVTAYAARYPPDNPKGRVKWVTKAREVFEKHLGKGWDPKRLLIEIVFHDTDERRTPWELVETVESLTGLDHTMAMTLHGMLDFDRRVGIKEYH